jgi:hypothetical protein
MKRHHLYALLGVSFALHVNAQTPPPPAPSVTPPVVAQVPSHPPTEPSNTNPFKPKEVPPSPAPGSLPPNQPPMPIPMSMSMPMQPTPGPNGETPKKLGSLNGVMAYRGTDSGYQFIQGPNQ